MKKNACFFYEISLLPRVRLKADEIEVLMKAQRQKTQK